MNELEQALTSLQINTADAKRYAQALFEDGCDSVKDLGMLDEETIKSKITHKRVHLAKILQLVAQQRPLLDVSVSAFA